MSHFTDDDFVRRLQALGLANTLDGGWTGYNPPLTVTAATQTLTVAAHAGKTIVFDLAAGITVTLPKATGSGAKFRFFTKTTFTGSGIIQVANATDVMQGFAQIAQDSADTVVMFETASTSDTITMNGSTKGGIIGDWIEIEDVAAGFFSVRAFLSGTSTEATPFSAAVS